MAFYDDLARDPKSEKEFWAIMEETFVQVGGALTAYPAETREERKMSVIAHFVTEIQAEGVLAKLGPWLRDQPPTDQFREQLDATVETIRAIRRASGHYRAVSMALGESGLSAQRLKTALRATEESSTAREMTNFIDLLKLADVSVALVAVDKVERDLSRLPEVLSGQQKTRKGPTARAWYSGFIRDLAEIAEGIGIEVTTGGDRSKNPHATPFTRFVFAVEKLLPLKEQSRRSATRGSLPRRRLAPLAACARRIDRAIAASVDDIGEVIRRKGEPVNEVPTVRWDPADFLVDVGFAMRRQLEKTIKAIIADRRLRDK